MKSGNSKAPPAQRNAAAVYTAGLAAFEQGRLVEAIEQLSRIADRHDLPGTLGRFYLGQAHLQHGLDELRLGRYVSAARHLTSAREINPASVDLARYLVACHVGRRRYDLAAAELEKALDEGREDRALPIRLAHALARDGQPERARETLERAISAAPQRADLHYQLGILLAAQEDYPAALPLLREAARLAPLGADINQHLGLTLAAAGDLPGAVRHLAMAQKLRPQDAHLALLLALAGEAAQSGEPDLSIDPAPICAAPADEPAMQALGDIIIEDSGFIEAFLNLPETEVDVEVFAMLAGVLERVLERLPDYADLHYHCSRVYSRLGRTESAIAAADRAVEINPRYVQALIQLGRLYAETDRSAEAVDRLETAVVNGGDYPDVHFLLGQLHRQGGRYDKAGRAFRRSLELNSGYDRARSALAELASA